MSTEQDKDTFSIERHRGGDGGLEALGGPNVMLTSPDKKKCKSETPSFSTLTEYAPPPNPSTDCLVAANPFDDSYSPSFKPLSVGNPYLSPSQYPGLGSYGPPRMATVMSGRMLSPCGPYQVRSQLHRYPQNQAGFSLPPGSTYRHQENSAFRNQSLFSIKYNNMSLPPNQFVRPGLGNTINQVLQQYGVHTPPPEHTGPSSGPEIHPSRNPPLRTNPGSYVGLTHQESSFSLSNTSIPKSEMGDASCRKTSQNTSPRKPSQVSEEASCRDGYIKSRNRGSAAGQEVKGQKLNGIAPAGNLGNPSDLGNDAPKKSQQTGRSVQRTPPEKNIVGCAGGRGLRGDTGEGAACGNGSGGRAKHKTGMHPSRSSLSSAEPVYHCGICLNEVNDDQEAIMCEALCQKWFHRVCTGMTEPAYNLLTAEAWAVWGCDSCMKNQGALLLRSKEPTVPVHFPPFLFEAFLCETINDDKSSAKIGNGVVVFTLQKKTERLWENLTRDNNDKDTLREIRERAQLKVQEKLASDSKARAIKTQEEKKYALETMMRLEEEERARIQKIKDDECEKATAELEVWKHKQKAVEETSFKTANKTEVKEMNRQTTAGKIHVNKDSKDTYQTNKKKCEMALPAPRTTGNIRITFTPRLFPTALRESRVPEEEQWLQKQAEARRALSADLAELQDLRNEEKNPDWLKDKGDKLFATGNYQAAVNAYNLAIKLNPRIPALFSNRAASHLKLRNLHKAIEDSSQALDLLTPPVEANAVARLKAHVRRGTAFCELELYAQGLEDYQAALKIHPQNEALLADTHQIRQVIQSAAHNTG